MNQVRDLPVKLQGEATSTLPPEKPHILLFWNQSSGTSSSSPRGSTSSEKERKVLDLNLDKEKLVQNKLEVRNMIEKIESGTEMNARKLGEEKKKENQKKVKKNSEMRKKEDNDDLKDETKMTNLQGLGPETRQGRSPTPSYLDSGDLLRVARSSAGTGLRAESNRDSKGHE
jgi:hypothetical protein